MKTQIYSLFNFKLQKQVVNYLSKFALVLISFTIIQQHCYAQGVCLAPPFSHLTGTFGIVDDLNNDGIKEIMRTEDNDMVCYRRGADNQYYEYKRFTPKEQAYSLVKGDFNQDGLLDYLNPQGGHFNILFRGTNGSFYESPNTTIPSSAQNIIVADFNNDGYPDIACSMSSTTNVVLSLNDGTGAFLPYVQFTLTYAVNQMVARDFNNDGNMDLAMTTGNSNYGISLMLGNGLGGFSPQSYISANSSSFILSDDFNGDGNMDLLTTDGYWRMRFGTGNGAFNAPVQYSFGSPVALKYADVDTDGIKDLIIIEIGTSLDIYIYKGMAGGVFASTATYINLPDGNSYRNFEIADINNDSYPDIVYFGSGKLYFYYGNGSINGFQPTFSQISANVLKAIPCDFNADGLIDIAYSLTYDQGFQVKIQKEKGTYYLPNFYSTACPIQVTGYFNSDSLPDFAAINKDGNGDTLYIYYGFSGYGGFGPPVKIYNPKSMMYLYTGDFNNDGRTDIVSSNGSNLTSTQHLSFFAGYPSGGFSAPVHYTSSSYPEAPLVSISDFDNDGKLDLGIRESQQMNTPFKILHGNGNGTFTLVNTVFTGGLIQDLTAADITNDGLPDMIATIYDSLFIYPNIGSNNFGTRTTYYTSGFTKVASGDINKDGYKDVLLTTGVILGQSSGALGPINFFDIGGYVDGISAVADFNDDGNNDVEYYELNAMGVVYNLSNFSIAHGNDTIGCTGSQLSLTAAQYNGLNYQWNTGDTTETILVNTAGNYYVTVTNTTNACSVASDTIAVNFYNCDSVWPGDANMDLVANNFDLLPIGINYGDSGIARGTISNTWAGQPATSWGSVYTSIDKKFIDCNGDGVINHADTLAINLNYGSIHTAKTTGNNQTFSNSPQLFFTTSSTNYYAGDTVTAELWLGTGNNPVLSFYGMAFDIAYPSNMVVAGSEQFNFVNSFMGVVNANILKIEHFNSSGSISAATTRITHTSVDGYGKIAELKFVAAQNAATTPMILSVVSPYANDEAGNSLDISATNDTILISPSTGINEENVNSSIFIYPNPATNYLTISLPQLSQKAKVSISDITGKIIYNNADVLTQKLEVNTKDFSDGIYFVRIQTAGFVETKKLIMAK